MADDDYDVLSTKLPMQAGSWRYVTQIVYVVHEIEKIII